MRSSFFKISSFFIFNLLLPPSSPSSAIVPHDYFSKYNGMTSLKKKHHYVIEYLGRFDCRRTYYGDILDIHGYIWCVSNCHGNFLCPNLSPSRAILCLWPINNLISSNSQLFIPLPTIRATKVCSVRYAYDIWTK